MKSVKFILASLLVLLAMTTPAIVLAKQATKTAPTVASGIATPTASIIVYPETPPDASAAQAYASTPWEKSGDTLNLVIAILSVGAIFAIIIWGIIASRRTPTAV